MADSSEITAPVAKATTALGASAGTAAMAMTDKAQSFLPTDLAGWLAVGASAAALLYSVHLLAEWYWKKAIRSFAERRGWIKHKPAPKVIVIDPEQLGGE